jgi:hypothetical protein
VVYIVFYDGLEEERIVAQRFTLIGCVKVRWNLTWMLAYTLMNVYEKNS